MRVDVEPRQLSGVPGQPALITVTITNTRAVISGHRVRVLGVDPEWVTLDHDSLSLFPETAGVAMVRVTLPPGIPSGVRSFSVEVSELTPPQETSVTRVELTVPAELGLTMSVDPASVTGGSMATVALLVENTGNTPLDAGLRGLDDEGEMEFAFTPPEPHLDPGEELLGSVELRARRPWFGSPKVRSFTINAGPTDAPVVAFGAWVQRARLSRGALALLGLVAALTVFAVVIAATLSQVVSTSAADRDLAIQVAEGGGGNAGAGSGGISGTVTLLATGAAVQGVTVQLFTSSNTVQPVVSTATGSGGGYHFSGLAGGSYKIYFNGAGFNELWYPASLGAANAQAVNVKNGQKVQNINIRLGGLPASVSGQVTGGNPAGAILTLELPAPGSSPSAPAGNGGAPAVVTTQTLDASGNFSIAGIPSPSLYEIVVTQPGFAPAFQQIDLAGGESRTGIVIQLVKGDGAISGTVSSAAGPLGGATVSASDGSSTVNTMSLTTGAVGSFTLTGLATPASFSVLVSAPGFASQTLSLSLASGQDLTGIAVTLTSGVGSISGTVSTANGAPAGGVTVTSSNGQLVVSTVTLSVGAVGTYSLGGLPVPGTYSLTFSAPSLASQTQAVSLTNGAPNATGVNASLVSSTASIFGTVTQTGGAPLPQISILLTSGTTSYQATSATVPTPGAYEIDNITPGTYTISFTRVGGVPTSSIVTLVAGQRLNDNPVLALAASIFGHVVSKPQPEQASIPLSGVQVTLYLTTQFPTVSITSVTTDANGNFTIANVEAPQSFVVSFAFPPGTALQSTSLVTTSLGVASPICGAHPSPTCNPQADPVVVSTQ